MIRTPRADTGKPNDALSFIPGLAHGPAALSLSGRTHRHGINPWDQTQNDHRWSVAIENREALKKWFADIQQMHWVQQHATESSRRIVVPATAL
jgi:hypothetical protein